MTIDISPAELDALAALLTYAGNDYWHSDHILPLPDRPDIRELAVELYDGDKEMAKPEAESHDPTPRPHTDIHLQRPRGHAVHDRQDRRPVLPREPFVMCPFGQSRRDDDG